jgi:beta-lactamase superfamily II metal-dependent hydrolase
MRKPLLYPLAAALLAQIALHAQTSPPKSAQQKPLDIYFLDTEGGQATLFVAPSGQSMLMDTGFAGNQGMPATPGAPAITRDADRISAVLKLANISVLDYVVITTTTETTSVTQPSSPTAFRFCISLTTAPIQ